MSRSSSLTSLSATPPKYRDTVSSLSYTLPRRANFSSLTPLSTRSAQSNVLLPALDDDLSSEEEEPIEDTPRSIRATPPVIWDYTQATVQPPSTSTRKSPYPAQVGLDYDDNTEEEEEVEDERLDEDFIPFERSPSTPLELHIPTRVVSPPLAPDVLAIRTHLQVLDALNALPHAQQFQVVDINRQPALTRQRLDVDMWTVAMSPGEYGRRFSTSLAMVQLACYNGWVSDSRDGTEPEFKSWLLVGQNGHQLWVHPSIKGPFFQRIQQSRVIFPADNAWTYGNPMIPVQDFVLALEETECETIWLKTYGHKMGIPETEAIRDDPADKNHPSSRHNQFDIGITYRSGLIWLWASTSPNATTFPMIIPASKGYGSVGLDIDYNGHTFGVKIYPRMVHAIKAYRSRLKMQMPKTMNGFMCKVQSMIEVLDFLGRCDPDQVGGFRIEVSVGAPSLQTARDMVMDTPLLDPQFWLNPPDGREMYRMDAKVATLQGLVANGHWAHARADELGHLRGSGGKKTNKVHRRVMTDLMAAMGFNGGRRRLTSSIDPRAWWWYSENEVAAMGGPALGPLRRGTAMGRVFRDHCDTNPRTRQVLTKLRGQLPLGKLPCPIYPLDNSHVMQLSGRTPPGLRCRDKHCRRELNHQPLFDYIASFVTEGNVRREDLMLDDADNEDGRPTEEAPATRTLRSRFHPHDSSEDDLESSLSSGDESAYME